MAQISKTAAIKQARENCHVCRQGHGWVMVTWDESAGVWHEANEAPFHEVRPGSPKRGRRKSYDCWLRETTWTQPAPTSKRWSLPTPARGVRR